MNNYYDYKKFAILYVDDEEKSLKYFTRAFEDQFRILTAARADDGLKLVEEHQGDLGVLMTDQRMPGNKGVWLLEKARQIQPRIIRILATAYADMDAAIAAINSGAIYKYVTKPWDPPTLENTLKRALEFFIVQRERDQLLREKLAVLHNMMIADRMVSLGLLAAGLSHHIRNSLVAVKTFLDLAPSKLKEEEVQMDNLRNPDFWKDYYRNVQTQIEKINNMLKDLWAASEKPSFEFKDVVHLNQVIAGVLEKLKDKLAAKKIGVTVSIPDSLPALTVDEPKFVRLFELLIEDEVVSLPPGSQVSISAQSDYRMVKQGEIRIEVRDNGPGLPEDALRLIFDPFLVRSDSPMEYGIKLMACFFIVHHHGGTIIAQSQEQKGTNFMVRLPINPNQRPLVDENQQFFEKILMNDVMWEKLITSD
ncbi:MAG TPA: hybrid sensor histidine kinase/response regulator [Haliangiales bacterium]|nr:hybrid sensor histidine kinase/response regulator [Haliangiales bacterium]